MHDYLGGVKSTSYYKSWIAPFKEAMSEFGIVTPKQIAAFLAEVGHESGGATNLKENLVYTYVSSAMKFSAFGSEQDVRNFYENTLHLTPTSFDPITHLATRYNAPGEWTDDVQTQFANKVYAPGTVQGNKLGNTQPGDGGKFRGYGLIQLTGRANVTGFANYIDSYNTQHNIQNPPYTGAQILADPKGTIGTDPILAARSAAWFWSVNRAKSGTPRHPVAHGLLNDEASLMQWVNGSLQANQNTHFQWISQV